MVNNYIKSFIRHGDAYDHLSICKINTIHLNEQIIGDFYPLFLIAIRKTPATLVKKRAEVSKLKITYGILFQ